MQLFVVTIERHNTKTAKPLEYIIQVTKTLTRAMEIQTKNPGSTISSQVF